WTGSGNMLLSNDAHLNNLAGGVFTIHTAEPPGAEPPGIIFTSGSDLNNASGGSIVIDTAQPVGFTGGNFNNAGTLNWIGSGNIAFANDTHLNNLAGGVFTIHTAQPLGAQPVGI